MPCSAGELPLHRLCHLGPTNLIGHVCLQAAEPENARQILAETTKKISLLGKQGKAREAVKQLADMARQHGVQPDTQAATALLAACCRNRQVDLARSVFDELFGEPGWC